MGKTPHLDSGIMVTLVRPDFAKTPILVDVVAIICIHGDTKNNPTILLHLQSTNGQCTGPVGVVPNLPVPVLIWRDSPMFRQLWAIMSGDGGSPKVGGSWRSTRAVRKRETRM